MFSEYVAQTLCPTLHPTDIVIIDSLSAYTNSEAAEQITKCGAELLCLPPDSPDLNPLENMWGNVKQLLRGMEMRTYDALEKGIANALDLVCARDAHGWFKNGGCGSFQV
ncbi:MAG: transposase [Pseudodesulfovibrio sp.]